MTGLCHGQPYSCAFFGFFCSGEICSPPLELFDSTTHISFQWIASLIPNSSVFQLKQSKTDPFGKCVSSLCWQNWRSVLTCGSSSNMGDKRGSTEGPLFYFMDGSVLTQQRFVTELQKVLHTIGEDPSKYGGHSFRSGAAATTAAQQGIGDATIKLLGRWRSSAYQVYIKTLLSNLAKYSRTLTQSIYVPGVSCATHSDLP